MRGLGSWKGMVLFTLDMLLAVLVYSSIVGSLNWRVLLVLLTAPLMYLMFKYLDASGLPLLVRLMIIMGFFGFLALLFRVLTMLGIPVR
jgi:hypothetical protein